MKPSKYRLNRKQSLALALLPVLSIALLLLHYFYGGAILTSGVFMTLWPMFLLGAAVLLVVYCAILSVSAVPLPLQLLVCAACSGGYFATLSLVQMPGFSKFTPFADPVQLIFVAPLALPLLGLALMRLRVRANRA